MSTTSTDTYDQVGIREELSDLIYSISPEDTPFFSNCGSMEVDNTFFEWQTDDLAAVSTDTAVEGADATFAPASATTRVGNYTEIIEKTAMTSGSLEATDRAGRNREMAYQVLKRAKEIRRDFEHHLVGLSNAKAAGSASVARETASVQTWLATNTNRGATGADPTGDGSDTPTDGTQRAFTEALLGDVIDKCYISGGNPHVIMAAPFNKRAMNAFSGNADAKDFGTEGKKIINAVSLYESDYGAMKVVPNRWLRARDVLVLEMDYWKIATLRPMRNTEIAKTGDAEKRQVIMEAGLCAANESASGIVADLTVS